MINVQIGTKRMRFPMRSPRVSNQKKYNATKIRPRSAKKTAKEARWVLKWRKIRRCRDVEMQM